MATMLEIIQSKGQSNNKSVSEYLTAQTKIREAVVEFLASAELEKQRNRQIRDLKSRRNTYIANILAGVDVVASRNFAEEINRTLRSMGVY